MDNKKLGGKFKEMCMIELALSPATKKILNKKKTQLSDKLDFMKKKKSVFSRCWYHTTNDFLLILPKIEGITKIVTKGIKITLDVNVKKKSSNKYGPATFVQTM